MVVNLLQIRLLTVRSGHSADQFQIYVLYVNKLYTFVCLFVFSISRQAVLVAACQARLLYDCAADINGGRC